MHGEGVKLAEAISFNISEIASAALTLSPGNYIILSPPRNDNRSLVVFSLKIGEGIFQKTGFLIPKTTN